MTTKNYNLIDAINREGIGNEEWGVCKDVNTADAQGKIFLDSVKNFVNARRENNAMPNMDIFSVDETLYINTFQPQGTRDIIGFLSVDTQAIVTIEHSRLVKVHQI